MRALLIALAALAAFPAHAAPDAIAPAVHYADGVTCDEEAGDGFQRRCRLDDPAAAATPAGRQLIVDHEGRLASWTGDRPATADAPLAFRGWWVDPGKPCDAWGDDSQLRIGANLAQFYVGEGRIQSVKVLGAREIEMVLDMHTDPGDQPTLHLKLSDDGQRLFQMDLDNGYERKRCPGWP